ncbi:MAG TPA: class I SAM-dependent methyltransferase, partial [Nocardioidaceae bacterium]|nr:class I SAM-dependent methyltransferase [Nocardioidaceae bacterium]
ALPEIARVLRPGGTLSIVWNYRDETVPWVRRLGRIIGSDGPADDPVEVLEESGLFDGTERQTFRHWQQVGRESLIGLVASRSVVVTMGERERAEVLAAVGALYDDYGRGHDGMLLPYVTHCFRAHVSSARFAPRQSTDGLDDGLLIDFS